MEGSLSFTLTPERRLVLDVKRIYSSAAALFMDIGVRLVLPDSVMCSENSIFKARAVCATENQELELVGFYQAEQFNEY